MHWIYIFNVKKNALVLDNFHLQNTESKITKKEFLLTESTEVCNVYILTKLSQTFDVIIWSFSS